MTSHDHAPVLVEEAMTWLAPRAGGKYIDATVGRGGHARRLLDLSGPGGRLLGLDADPQAIDSARVSLRAFAGRVLLEQSYFDDMVGIARKHGFEEANGILFDLGVSSPQVDDAARGFSFQAEGPLDMRMTAKGPTAADLVATAMAEDLVRIFREYGEERYARRIAGAIVRARQASPLVTTTQLAGLITRAVPGPRTAIHPATRVFQALRIAVNDELARLERGLVAALDLLRKEGRLVVISFHSLEDRIVKRFLRREASDCVCPPGLPQCVCGHVRRLRILTPKPTTPSEEERLENPRSRSAKLRAAAAL